MTSPSLSRRAALRGLGTCIALPWLEAMLPRSVVAAVNAPAATELPLRLAFMYIPNGCHMEDWTPASLGAGYQLPWILQPLASHQKDLLVLSGLTLDKARANGDGGGDHARAMSAFLTGRQPRKTDGADIRAGISADQVAAERVGGATRFRSLELGCEPGRQAGNCDSGYSCAYSSNLSWRGEASPNAKEVDPKLVFERLFGNNVKPEEAAARAKREQRQKSILDFVLEDANDLRRQLGATDQRKVDEYLTAIRDIELRIQKAKDLANKPIIAPNVPRPAGTPREYADHIRLMYDLMALAFQGDLTRVATFAHANDGSNRAYPFLQTSDGSKVSEGHHDLSHHAGDKKKHDKIRTINKFHIEQYAYFLTKLKGIKEGAGTLFDRCMLVYGSGISDGNRHNHDELPILLTGGAAAKIKPGRHVRVKKETPLMNLYLSLLDRMGAPVDSLGDSTGRLAGLDG